MWKERYQRHIDLVEIGVTGQQRINAASVAIIGAGGLGCSALQYLAAAGVGHIGIVDFDRVELSNLQRQVLYRDSDIGKYKCEVAASMYGVVTAKVEKLTPDNAKSLIENYDLVIDATDNFDARYAINDACAALHKPFVYGSIDKFQGQVALFHPPGSDYRTLFPEPPIQCSSCSEGGVIGALAGIIGSIQALEAIKWIAQVAETLEGKLLVLDALTWQTKLFQIGPIKEDIKTLKRSDYYLVDIRESYERGLNDEADLWIPFSQIFERYVEIPKDKKVVLFCQTGKRSSIAATKLRPHFLEISSSKYKC